MIYFEIYYTKEDFVMKVTIKTIFEENRVHLSLEGNPDNATKEELTTIQDKITEAVSVLLSLKSAPAVGIEGLERITAPDIAQVEPETSKPASKTSTKPTTAKKAQTPTPTPPPAPTLPEPTIGFGKYKDLTAKEVVEKYGKEGVEYLQNIILPPVTKNLAKFPQNAIKIEAINRAIAG